MSKKIEQSDLREGYNEAQIGPKSFEIPDEWELKTIPDLCNLNTESFDASNHSKETFEYIDIESVSQGVIDQSKTIPIEDAPSRAKQIVNSGDTLVGKVRPYLQAFAPVTEEHDGKVCSTGFAVLSAREGFSSSYITQAVLSKYFLDQMTNRMTGTSYPAVNKSDFKNVQIFAPPLPEQRRIADILSTVDEQIQQTDKIIEETKELKQGLMQDLLLTGINHNSFKKVNFGPESVEIPDSWEIVRLEDVVTNYRGGASLSSSDFTEDGVPVIPKGGINQRGVLRIPKEDQQFCSNEYANSNKSSSVAVGDLVTTSRDLVSSAPNIGRIVEVTEGEFIMAQGVNAIEPNNDKVNPKFLVQLSNSEFYRNHMKRIKVGSTQVHIRKDDFLSTPIPKPPIEEQNKIVDIISTSENQIREEAKRKSNLQSLKRGLMQDLLTGKVRVDID